MDRLSALDAEFLHLEDGIAHMHIAGACTFAQPAPGYDELADLLRSKLHRIPRYRQRVRNVPLELGRPVWVDDPDFELEYHLRHTALPSPDDDAFCTLMGRLMSQPLDRERPLWEAWLVEGLAEDRWALVFKVHHCMVDGIAGVELLTALLDVEADPPREEPRPWTPQPEPAGALKVLDAWSGLATDVVAAASSLPGAVVHPGRTTRALAGTTGGLVRYLGGLLGGSPRSLGGRIGPHRSWAHAEVSLEDVKAVRRNLGGTVNDVVLTAVTAGYRELLLARGEDPAQSVVTSMVPVSTRHDDGRGVPDNRVSMLLYELPVQLEDPVERLERVREDMAELKSSHMAEAGATVTRVGDLAPPMMLSNVSRLAIRALQRVPQRSINTVTTNVPGPQFPLYCLGRQMLGYWPFVPISHGVRVGTAILSYDGNVSFGITGDRATAPDVAVLARSAVECVEQLARLPRTNDRSTPPRGNTAR